MPSLPRPAAAAFTSMAWRPKANGTMTKGTEYDDLASTVTMVWNLPLLLAGLQMSLVSISSTRTYKKEEIKLTHSL